MANFKVEIVRIETVEDHPNADKLSVIRLVGKDFNCISGKVGEELSHRYAPGDLVAYIPEAALLPDWLLKRLDFWKVDETTGEGKGTLFGPEGRRLKAIQLRGLCSQGMLYPCESHKFPEWPENVIPRGEASGSWNWKHTIDADGVLHQVIECDDVAEILGITKYNPPIPSHLAGEVCNVFGHTVKYDFDNWQNMTDIIDDGVEVVAHEKLHGTFCCVAYVPGLNHPELFGSNGDLFVGSKGLSAQGLVFKNVPNNAGNAYVKVLVEMLSNGYEEKVAKMSENCAGKPIYLFGEIFGKGVQDLDYGLEKPEFRVFDMKVGNDFIDYDQFQFIVEEAFCLAMVPLLYRGPFDVDVIKSHRDGKTVFNGANVREGVVVKTVKNSYHRLHGRRICKFVSPDYLMRKAKKGVEVTEFN